MLLSPGDRVDRYEVLDLLGTGGMGEVYRARDPKLARLVALKMLRTDVGATAGGSDRLLREARAVAALGHPNVLSVYDVGRVEEPEALRGTSYIAMELVVGRSLRSYIGDATVPMERRIGWLCDVARALAAAHDAGIVHRDVKPENVMVRADGVVKVLDFGIARRVALPAAWSSIEGHSVRTGDATAPTLDVPMPSGQGAVVGTPFYMAPEQLRGEDVDARVDQFAWGVVAYTLLVGRPPWHADLIALLTQILSYDPPAPAEVDASIPCVVSDVVVRAMAKRREDRFATMAELLAAVGQETSVRVAARPARRPARASRRLVLGAGASALVLTGAALAWRARGESPAMATRSGAPATAPSSAAAAAPNAPTCATNAECVHAHGGEAWHCNARRHECVSVASEDCKPLAAAHDAEADDVVWLGALYPVADHIFDSEPRAADMARQEFALALGASAARPGALHARPIALAMCDEATDENRAARHLAEDLEVPAVIGFRSTSGAVDAISTVLLPQRVLSVVTISQATRLTQIPEPPGEPRLVWRTTLDYQATTAPLATFITSVLEPAARAAGLGTRPFRVATVLPAGAPPEFVDSIFRSVRFNGRSALENGADFREFVLEPGSTGANGHLVGALATFAPNVIFTMGDDFPGRVLFPLEARWGVGPRPTYLTTSSLDRELLPWAGSDASRRRRFFAVTNLSTTATNGELVLHYNAAFPREPIERSEAPQPSYDAFYLLAYATYAIGDGPVTGPALSGAFDRLLPPGTPIDVGPDSIYPAFTALRGDGRIDLNGAIGSLDFDRASGESPIDYAIVCFGVDDHGRAAPQVDSGLVYDSRSGALNGTLRCP